MNHLSTFEDFDKNLLAAKSFNKKMKLLFMKKKSTSLLTNGRLKKYQLQLKE